MRLLVRAMGTAAVVERFTREFTHAKALDGEGQLAVWQEVREYTPRFLAANPNGGLMTIPCSLVEMRGIAERLAASDIPFIARAGSGVVYAYHSAKPPAVTVRDDAEMMKRVKRMFDPENLLNRGASMATSDALVQVTSPDAPQQVDLDKCVHCGLCLNACPTYRELHVEMDSPRGRIFQMKQVAAGGAITDSYIRHLDLCLACRGCESACPSGVAYGRLIEAARTQIEPYRKRSWAARTLR